MSKSLNRTRNYPQKSRKCAIVILDDCLCISKKILWTYQQIYEMDRKNTSKRSL